MNCGSRRPLREVPPGIAGAVGREQPGPSLQSLEHGIPLAGIEVRR